MPTVKNYGNTQVATKALPGVRLTAAPTEETFGVAGGDKIARVGMQLFEDELQRQDQVAVLEADRRLSEWENKRLYDPREGALAKRGKDAFGLPDAVGTEFEAFRDEIRAGLSTDRQRVAFDRQAMSRRSDIDKTLSRHVFSEVRKFDDTETENYLMNSRQAAISNAGDPARVGLEIERQVASVTDYANRNGLGAEYVKQKTAQARSDTHVSVVERMLANGQDMTAKAYVDKVRPEIAGDDIAKVEKWIEEGTTRGESQRQADTIMQSTTTRESALEKARTITDPKLRDAVEERVNRYYTLKKEAEREHREKIMTDAANIIDQTGSIDKIPPSTWSAMTVAERGALTVYANRNAKGEGQSTDMGTYYSLVTLASSPATQDAFARTNLLTYINKLSPGDFKHVVALQAAIRGKDSKEADKLLSSDRVQNQIVSDAVLSLGLDPTPNEKTPEEKRNQVIEFRRVVREQVAAHEQRTQKNATDADVQRIVDNLIVKGKVPGSGWFFDSEKRVYQLKEGESLIIKPKDVPRGERIKIEEALRRQGRAITDDAVVTLYTARILGDRGAARPAAPSMVDKVPK